MGALIPWPKMPVTHDEVTGIIIGWSGWPDDDGEILDYDVMVVMTDDGGLLSRWMGYDVVAPNQQFPEQFITTGDRVRFFN